MRRTSVFQNTQGQTLVELVIAIAVILVGVMGTITLAILTITLARESKQRVVAANLAREGIELARVVRDSNWLAGDAFETGFKESSTDDYSFVWEWNPDAGVWTQDFSPDVPDFNDDANTSTVVYRNAARYVQDVSGGTGLTPTNYRRIMQTNYICADTMECTDGVCSDGEGTCSGSSVQGIQVIARVHWTDRQQTKTLNIEEELYDWR